MRSHIVFLVVLAALLAGCRSRAPAEFRAQAFNTAETMRELASGGGRAPAVDDDPCPPPNNPIPDPPDATRDQIVCALAYYAQYLDCFFNTCAPADCKCKINCWTQYILNPCYVED